MSSINNPLSFGPGSIQPTTSPLSLLLKPLQLLHQQVQLLEQRVAQRFLVNLVN